MLFIHANFDRKPTVLFLFIYVSAWWCHSGIIIEMNILAIILFYHRFFYFGIWVVWNKNKIATTYINVNLHTYYYYYPRTCMSNFFLLFNLHQAIKHHITYRHYLIMCSQFIRTCTSTWMQSQRLRAAVCFSSCKII